MNKAQLHASGLSDRWARRLVQLGFLLLFLFPLLPVIMRRVTSEATGDTASWLLLWDPLLALGNLLNRNLSALMIGAPLLLLALSLLLGRSFCGWLCPLGTMTDLVRPLYLWQRNRRVQRSRERTQRNSRLRYLLLVMALGGSLLSIRLLGLLDPLIIFSRAATAAASDLMASLQASERGGLTYFSLLFVAILLLEIWQPRFWCRHLCPQGALLSLVTRFSLLNRRVSTACNNCELCRRACPMDAIPQDAHNTDYGDCTFCLECQSACPLNGIHFGFGGLALGAWQPAARTNRREGEYIAAPSAIPGAKLDRRAFLQGMGAAAAGLAFLPLTRLEPQPAPLRPPGALPEAQFLDTCIACQECVRICPTHGLQAAFLQAGVSRIGTPVLVPRAGACSINVSCNHLCQQVCPVQAILPVKPRQFQIGLAQVDHSLCLAWDQGLKCLVCVEACQYHAAIPLQGKVTVDANNCVGCGACESGCPVLGSAIHVKPRKASTI